MGLFKGIAHVAYRVSDMQKSLNFYCTKLEMKHAFSLKDDSGKPWIEYLKLADNQFIELFYSTEPLTHSGSYMHLCLEVEDCVKVAEVLESAGVDVYNKPKQGKDLNWQCWIKDPDGNPIEIMQIDPSSPQAKS